ncbi:MAG: protein kinase domain-containing protein [Pseudonocardiaceae bacterium]
MKQGELLRGYRIISKPTNDGAGRCMWAFAEKNGKEYFVKEFLEPKRPRPESMGTPEIKQELLRQCEAFERRHWSVIELIDPRNLQAGNLVTAVDFFHEGTRYYKITNRLHPADLKFPHELTPHQKSVLLGTLADSLQLLHELGIVHGDLKPQNILLHQPISSDLYTAKLIDFDDAYISRNPPDRDIISGDALYGAPEWVRYMHGDRMTGPERLTTAADMFAFGLLMHRYLTGSLPHYDQRYGSPAEAVNARAMIHLDPRLHKRVARTVRALLSYDLDNRPTMENLLKLLDDKSVLTLDTTEHVASTTPASGSGRVRINPSNGSLTIPATARREQPLDPTSSPAPLHTPPEERRSRLRINLAGRKPT